MTLEKSPETLLSEEELTLAIERDRREEAVNFARANVGLEGFEIPDVGEKLFSQYVDGEISMQDVIKSAREYAQKR